MAGVLRLGVGSAWSLSQLRSFFPVGWRLINPSCGLLRCPCMGLQLLALLCSELAARPPPIGRCWLEGLRPMAAGRLKSDSHMQAPHCGAQLVVTASPHWPRGGQTKPQTGSEKIYFSSNCMPNLERISVISSLSERPL